MRSLQDWMKYLEQQEQAVKEKPEEEILPEPEIQTITAQETAVVEPPRPTIQVERPKPVVTPQQPRPAAPPTVEAPAPPPQPKPVVVQPPVAKPAVEKPVRTVTPPAAAVKPEEPQVRVRKPRTPKPQVQRVSPDETAQSSYKPFRESREELLQRLLDPLISLEEAARIMNVCPTTVRRYTNRGILKHYRTAGNQRRFRLSDVLTFMGSDAATQAAEE